MKVAVCEYLSSQTQAPTFPVFASDYLSRLLQACQRIVSQLLNEARTRWCLLSAQQARQEAPTRPLAFSDCGRNREL